MRGARQEPRHTSVVVDEVEEERSHARDLPCFCEAVCMTVVEVADDVDDASAVGSVAVDVGAADAASSLVVTAEKVASVPMPVMVVVAGEIEPTEPAMPEEPVDSNNKAAESLCGLQTHGQGIRTFAAPVVAVADAAAVADADNQVGWWFEDQGCRCHILVVGMEVPRSGPVAVAVVGTCDGEVVGTGTQPKQVVAAGIAVGHAEHEKFAEGATVFAY